MDHESTSAVERADQHCLSEVTEVKSNSHTLCWSVPLIYI